MINMKQWIDEYEELMYKHMINSQNVVFQDHMENATDKEQEMYCYQAHVDSECDYYVTQWYIQCNVYHILQQRHRFQSFSEHEKTVCFDEISKFTCSTATNNHTAECCNYYASYCDN